MDIQKCFHAHAIHDELRQSHVPSWNLSFCEISFDGSTHITTNQNKCEKKKYKESKDTPRKCIHLSKDVTKIHQTTYLKSIERDISKKAHQKTYQNFNLWIPTSVVGMWTSITWTRASRLETQVRRRVQPKKSDTKIGQQCFAQCVLKIQHIF